MSLQGISHVGNLDFDSLRLSLLALYFEYTIFLASACLRLAELTGPTWYVSYSHASPPDVIGAGGCTTFGLGTPAERATSRYTFFIGTTHGISIWSMSSGSLG